MSNEVALTQTSPIAEVLEAIDKKIDSIKKITDSVYVTSKRINMQSGECNIETETKIENLVRAFGTVIAKEKLYTEAQTELGITSVPVCKVDGFTKDDWKKDIQLRIAIIEQQDTLNQLSEMRKEWTDLMDKEDKKAILFKKMQAFAGASAE